MAILHAHHRGFGDLKILDVTSVVNLSKLRPAFERLRSDPSRSPRVVSRHASSISTFEVHRRALAKVQFSRVHDPSNDEFPMRGPVRADEETLVRLLALFAEVTCAPGGARVTLQLQRKTTEPEESKHFEDSQDFMHAVNATAIVCVNRDNIIGGVDEFRRFDDVNTLNPVIRRELPQGFMAAFDGADVLHRATQIYCLDGATTGLRDVVIMSRT